MKTESTETQEKKPETLEEAAMCVLSENQFNQYDEKELMGALYFYITSIKADIREFMDAVKQGKKVVDFSEAIKNVDAALSVYKSLREKIFGPEPGDDAVANPENGWDTQRWSEH